jgi:acyl-coenzyme A synthetase/AMP-(fatty) acid ligase
MERNSQFTFSGARALAAAALIATFAFASGPVIAAKDTSAERVEARIKDMHAKLKITQAQEEQWAKVAKVMRDNEKVMEPLINSRMEKYKTMTAIDDLKSYGEITDAHADAIKRFTPIFATLYAGMSDAQKKDSDTMFRRVGKTTKKKPV